MAKGNNNAHNQTPTVACQACTHRMDIPLSDIRDGVYVLDIIKELGWTEKDGKVLCPRCTKRLNT